jgi:hypothetical protein
MTEAGWLACDDVLKALLFLRRRLDPRSSRQPFGRFGDRRLRRKLRLFSGQVALDMRRDEHPEIPDWETEWLFIQDDIDRWSEDQLKDEDLCGESYNFFVGFWGQVYRSLELWRSSWTVAVRAARFVLDRAGPRSGSVACSLLRDIFGNPFRPVVFSNGWRTDILVSLAQRIYKSYDFSMLPMLANALQDAGCDNEDILNHCRQSTEHVRGCWAIDLLLNKN